MSSTVERLHNSLLGERADTIIRRLTLLAAMVGFLGHLALWLVSEFGVVSVPQSAQGLLNSPLAALYTPFSILLTYEVYQLIRAIPDSFSTAVGKQFEVATLLVVRDVFKRLAGIEFGNEWVIDANLALVLVECATFIVLLYTAIAYRGGDTKSNSDAWQNDELRTFVRGKQTIAVILLFTFLTIGILSFLSWLKSVGIGVVTADRTIFFSDFFTCLILADVFVLLLSYKHSHDFYALVRNTGFVLSTVILRVAISAPGLASMALFVVSGSLGVMILRLTSRYQGHTRDESP